MGTLENIEQQQYSKVSGAIDFFSQILHLEQLTDYGHPFISALLDLRSSSMFMKDPINGGYVLRRTIQDDPIVDYFENNERFKQVATKIGRVLTSGFDRVFDQAFLEQYPMNLFFPLIVQDDLIGFIISRELNEVTSNPDDTYIESIKNLANMAFFIGIGTEKQKKSEGSMDRKLYNMMLLHQVNRLLLSELKLEALYQLCVDSVRELTSSSVTAFALMDPHKSVISVRAYNDIVSFKPFYGEVTVKPTKKPDKIVYRLESEKELLKHYFVDVSIFEKLSADYVILLVEDSIEGFVTIGTPVSGIPFTTDTLDLIESLMVSVRIALTNAHYLNELTIQKRIIDDSYHAMSQLNLTLRTLGSCSSDAELSDLVLKTLEIHNGLDRSLMLLWDRKANAYRVTSALGEPLETQYVHLSDEGRSKLSKGLFYHYDPTYMHDWFPELRQAATVSLIAPIASDGIDSDETNLMGFIIGLESSQALLTAQLHYMENLASSLSPIVKLMLNEIECKSIKDVTDVDKLKSLLNHFESERQNYFMDFVIGYKKIKVSCLAEPDLTAYKDYQSVYSQGYLFAGIFDEQIVDEQLFDGIFSGSYETLIENIENLV